MIWIAFWILLFLNAFFVRYLLELCYDGTNYCGWQRQKNSITIQGCIDEILTIILKSSPKTVGSSRTDTGVHAEMQHAHFDTHERINSLNKFIRSMNALLPIDISVKNIYLVNDEFHTRFHATKRVYIYRFVYIKEPFLYKNATFSYKKYQVDLLNQISTVFIQNDLNCKYISKKSDNQKNFLCSIYEASWTETDNGIIFKIAANRFLRGMVRIIISLSLEVEKGRFSLGLLKDLIKNTRHFPLPKLAPAKGLTLFKIEYANTKHFILDL